MAVLYSTVILHYYVSDFMHIILLSDGNISLEWWKVHKKSFIFINHVDLLSSKAYRAVY